MVSYSRLWLLRMAGRPLNSTRPIISSHWIQATKVCTFTMFGRDFSKPRSRPCISEKLIVGQSTMLHLAKDSSRRKGEPAGGKYFSDPWFDGHNYECTIIATPNRGSALQSGKRHDLEDDEVVRVVQRELEFAVFKSKFEVQEFSLQEAQASGNHVARSLAEDASGADVNVYHFGSIEHRDDVNLWQGHVAEEVGRSLWSFLDPDGTKEVPPDLPKSIY